MPLVAFSRVTSLMALMPAFSVWARAFACAFVTAIALTALLVRIAPARGWVVPPRKDRWNRRVVAEFGGLPILLAFSGASLFASHSKETLVLLLLTWGMGALGLVDDIVGLGPKAKLFGQIILASLAVNVGIMHRLTGIFWADALFTVFWIVGITNAINLLDNMDGLAAGIAIIALVQVVLFAGFSTPVTAPAICMLGALVAFLFFNLNPAKVFMGDVGAFAIGFFLACASVKAAAHLSSLGSVLFVPCLVLFIPVFDTLLVTVTRRMHRKAISRGARDHASHRLVLAGLTERQAVALLCAIAAIAGVMAFLWKASWADLGAGIVALFLIAATLFWVYLAQLQLPASWLSDGEVGAVPALIQQILTSIAVIVLDAALVILGLYFVFVIRFGKLDTVLFGRFLFAAALSIAIKLTLLMAFGVYEQGWSIKRRKDIYPILKAVGLAAVFLTVVSLILPPSKRIGSINILFDTLLTSGLLLLGRASPSMFDRLFSRFGVFDSRTGRPSSAGHFQTSSVVTPGPPAETEIETPEPERERTPR